MRTRRSPRNQEILWRALGGKRQPERFPVEKVCADPAPQAPRSSDMPAEVQLALGRMFRLMSRPSQAGDVEQYETCRRIILDAQEARA
jgi:hypothetical protein